MSCSELPVLPSQREPNITSTEYEIQNTGESQAKESDNARAQDDIPYRHG